MAPAVLLGVAKGAVSGALPVPLAATRVAVLLAAASLAAG